jgi:hypothetical protein
MSKKYILLTVLILLLASSMTVRASWVFYSVEDLIKKSDVIMIGYINGPAGTGKDEHKFAVTYWDVNVNYYLKGNITAKKYYVITPGASSLFNRVKTSIDYSLNKGTYALFFLSNHQPLTPRGVVYLSVNDINKFSNLSSGIDISKEIRIWSGQFDTEEAEKLIKFVDDSSISLPTVDNLSTKRASRILPALLCIFSALVVALFLFKVYRKRKVKL